MTDLRKTIEEMKSAAEKASPGPWEDVYPNADDGDIRVQLYYEHKRTIVDNTDSIAWKLKAHNAVHIARSNPRNVLALTEFALDAIRTLQMIGASQAGPFTAKAMLDKHGIGVGE